MKNVCAELEMGNNSAATAPAFAPRNSSHQVDRNADGHKHADEITSSDPVNNAFGDGMRPISNEDCGFSTNKSTNEMDVAQGNCAQQKVSVNNCVQAVAPVFSNGSSGSSNDSSSQVTCCSVGEISTSCEEEGAKPKRKGIADFLPKNIFHWRSSTERLSSSPADFRTIKGQCCNVVTQCSCSSCGRETNCHSPKNFNQERCRDCYALEGPVSSCTRSKKSDDLVANSTMALILENRPLNLPAKPLEELQRHKQQYEQMIEAAKKKELKVAKLKKKQVQQQHKYENQLSAFAKVWNQEVLPNWEIARNTRKTRDLWWQGIPPSVRGKVWKLAIGNELNITPELYEICVSRAKDRIKIALESASISEEEGVFLEETSADKEASVDLIKLDVSRTFPQLCIFQKGGPYYDILHSLLGAYVCYRPDVGYVQGMSFLAAVLILNMDVADAFVCFTNLLNKPCHLAFFRLDEPMMKCYFLTYEEFFRENMPRLFIHFQKHNLTPDLYLIDWIYTLYSRSLPLDVACRVWDVFLRDGEEFLFRTALGILHLYEDILMKLEFIHLAQYLTRLPDDISADLLFKSIDCVKMVTEKRRFAQVLMLYTDPRGS